MSTMDLIAGCQEFIICEPRHTAATLAVPAAWFGIGGPVPQLPDFQAPIARSLAELAFILLGDGGRGDATLH
jgi:hypothetical protein